MSDDERSTAIFSGVRVVELAGGIAGPIVGQILADFGADVIKVEPPEGDRARCLPGFLVWNRGKRGITVDTAATCDRRLVALLDGADVCIVRDVGDKPLGVDLEAVRRDNPGLIVVGVPPYESDTPWYGGDESETLLAASTGAALRQSSTDGGPVECVSPLILNAQGLWAATCTIAALIERERSGHGQSVTVSGVHALAYVSAGSLTKDPSQPEQVSAVGSGGPNPFYTRYRCSDGQWVFAGALVHEAQLRYLEVLGLSQLLDDPRSGGGTQTMITPGYRDWVREQFAAIFATRPRDRWLGLFEAADLPCGPLLTREQWFDHPQVQAAGLRHDVEDPEHGQVSMPGIYVRGSRTSGEIRRCAPRLGEHDLTVKPWPPRNRPAGLPPTKRGPLEGFRIVNLGTYLAGPYAGVLLSELGADVLKVEMLSGDPFRVSGFTYNRGMRSLAMNLRSADGQDALYEVVRASDAVLDNGRVGVMTRLRADYASLAAVKPDIVTSSVTGFGEDGPLAARPALDLVLQAMSGTMRAQGGDDEPVIVTISINDVTAAILCALGACLGLYERERSGRGQCFATSLAAAATCIQSGDYVWYMGIVRAPHGGRDFRGTDAAHRFVQVADGWIRVEASSVAELDTVPELTGLTRQEATAMLFARGVPATAARSFGELRADAQLAASEFTHSFKRSDGSTYTTPGRFALFGRTQMRDKLFCPGVGEHSREVLSDAGLSNQRIDELIETQVVVQGTPFDPVIFNYR